MSKPDGHHSVVVKFKSRSERSESKTECLDSGSVAMVRSIRLWPHLKQPNSQVASDGVVLGKQPSRYSQDLTDRGGGGETGCCGGGQMNWLMTDVLSPLVDYKVRSSARVGRLMSGSRVWESMGGWGGESREVSSSKAGTSVH